MSASPFPPTSRYAGSEIAMHRTAEIASAANAAPEIRLVPYVRRRFVPPPERFALLQEHIVVEGDRVDNLAAHYLGDPELFWRLCDANGLMRPDELTAKVGRPIRITLPEGIPGASHA